MQEVQYRRRKNWSILGAIVCILAAVFFDSGTASLGGEWSVSGVMMTLSIGCLGSALAHYGQEIGARSSHRYYGVLYTKPGQIRYFKIGWMIGGLIIALGGAVVAILAMSGGIG